MSASSNVRLEETGYSTMGNIAAFRSSQIFSGHFAVRLLIVSYFIALALGLIKGVDLAVLAAPFMPTTFAKIVSGLGVVGLSAMILFGYHRRLAALLLAIVLFWCSYLASLSPLGLEDIGSFWRDLALIGALLLTYADAEGDKQAPAYGTLPQGGQIATGRECEISAQAEMPASQRPVDAPPKAQFREDFDIVRAT